MKKKLLYFAIALITLPGISRAADQIVTNNNDSGAGSLRQAIADVGDGETITFNISGSDIITITSELSISGSMTINGINLATGNPVTVQVTTPGTSAWRVFNIYATFKNITITDMTIRGGNTLASGYSGAGAGISVTNCYLNLERVSIKDGVAALGGGIFFNSSGITLTMNNCLINDNASTGNYGGGGLWAEAGYVYIINTTFNGNSASREGGAVYSTLNIAQMEFNNCSFTNNTSSTQGGAFYLKSKCVFIGCTFNSNTATSEGGAIYNIFGKVDIVNTTISGNEGSIGGGIYSGSDASARISLLNSVIVNNTGTTSSPNIYQNSPAAYAYYSWYTDLTGSFTAESNNNTTAWSAGDLTAIAYNGGHSNTLAVSVAGNASGKAGSGTYAYYNSTDGAYFYDGSDYKKISDGSTFTPSVPASDQIQTDQRGYYRTSGAITRGAYQYDGIVAKIGTGTSWTGGTDTYTTISGAVSTISDGSSDPIVLAGTSILEHTVIIDKSLTIQGGGQENTTVRVETPGTSAFRVFYIGASGKTITINNMTIKGGNMGQGGAMFINSGTVHLDHITMSDSRAGQAGGIYLTSSGILTVTSSTITNNATTLNPNIDSHGGWIYSLGGSVEVTSCTLTGNQASCGGAIFNATGAGSLTITSCTFNNNHGTAGGAVYNEGTAEITGSTFSNNVSIGNGGAILSYGTLDIESSTISNNTCYFYGGGIFFNGTTTLSSCSIANNHSDNNNTTEGRGGGIYFEGGSLTIKNTMIANNYYGSTTSSAEDYYTVGGTLTDNGYNLVETTNVGAGSNGFTDGTNNDIVGYQSNLFGTGLATQTLADNGGATQTLAIGGGSVAIARGAWDASITTDQRGVDRHQYYPAIGAYEPNPYPGYWTGETDTDWNTTSNWDDESLPGASDDVIVPDVTNDPIINEDPGSPALCNKLTIFSGASLNINPGKALTVSGNLDNGGTISIESDETGTGSLLIEGTSSGNVRVERYLSADKWHYISGQTNISDDFSTTMGLGTPGSSTNSFYRWDESYGTPTGTWIDILNGPTGDGSNNEMDETFVSCRGYGITYASTDKTLSLSGIPYTTNQSINITKTTGSTNPGANLVGNPFCSSIALNSGAQTTNNFIDQNTAVLSDVYGGVYLWNERSGWTGQYDYTVISNASAGTFAAPGQAFMVVAKTTGNSTLNFNENIRKHGSATFYKNNDADDASRVRLIITSAENISNVTSVAFLPGMTPGLDPSFDAGKLKGNPDLSIYTRLVDDIGVDFAIQALPDQNIEDYIIPIGVDVAEYGVFEFSVYQEMLDNYSLLLEDRQENIFTDLRWDTYFATISESGTGRFYLHFKDATAISEITPETKISFKYLDGKIHINNPDQEKGTISLVNVSGQVLGQFELDGNSTQEISFSEATGIYIITIQTDKTQVSRKVFIK